jgi:hypothetical protein
VITWASVTPSTPCWEWQEAKALTTGAWVVSDFAPQPGVAHAEAARESGKSRLGRRRTISKTGIEYYAWYVDWTKLEVRQTGIEHG